MDFVSDLLLLFINLPPEDGDNGIANRHTWFHEMRDRFWGFPAHCQHLQHDIVRRIHDFWVWLVHNPLDLVCAAQAFHDNIHRKHIHGVKPAWCGQFQRGRLRTPLVFPVVLAHEVHDN